MTKFISFVGTSQKDVVLSASRNVTDAVGYLESATVTVWADDFSAQSLTIQNTHGVGIQALALASLGQRSQYKNCNILGWQDTLYIDGLHYFTNTRIEGHVDFIYGPGTAVLDTCEVFNRAKGHLTAAKTPQAEPYGLVFLKCTLTADSSVPKNSTDLGRTWGPYAAVTFVDCNEGAHITSVGWNNMGHPEYQPTVRLHEYQDTGPGFNPNGRVMWSSQLSSSQAASYTIANILKGWKPSFQA